LGCPEIFRLYDRPQPKRTVVRCGEELPLHWTIGHLVAAGDAQRRSDAAQDFMLAWLYGLMVLHGVAPPRTNAQ
jgi:hypothetical protein